MTADEAWAKGTNERADPKIARLETEVARLSKLLGLVESFHAAKGEAPRWLAPTEHPRQGAATACLQLSDLHLDEVVDPAQVGGLNAYSREIAELRLKQWADAACAMGERLAASHKWDGALVLVDGDLVSGAIHDELRETNADHLPGTMVHWAPLIAAAIRQVADYFGRAHVPCVVGNHGRLTVKKSAKGRGRNSWDWLLCQMVRSYLATDSRITWDIADGSYLFVPIYDRHIYMTHGDEVGGGSGWAGVWSPLGTILRKGIEIAQAHRLRLDYAVVGHWHQTVLAHSRGLSCNGSMKGWDEFAATLRFRPEAAMQNFWVQTPERGVTLAAPLFLEDRRREGW